MPSLWRISNYTSLSGEGGLHFSARWHSAGHRIVYLAESPAGALVEALVHLELDEVSWPRAYQLLEAGYPDKLRPEILDPTSTRDWRAKVSITRKLGDDWLRSARSSLARVPSAILPDTWNVLLNPDHPDAAQIRVIKTVRADYDPRLVATPRRPRHS